MEMAGEVFRASEVEISKMKRFFFFATLALAIGMGVDYSLDDHQSISTIVIGSVILLGAVALWVACVRRMRRRHVVIDQEGVAERVGKGRERRVDWAEIERVIFRRTRASELRHIQLFSKSQDNLGLGGLADMETVAALIASNVPSDKLHHTRVWREPGPLLGAIMVLVFSITFGMGRRLPKELADVILYLWFSVISLLLAKNGWYTKYRKVHSVLAVIFLAFAAFRMLEFILR